MERAQNVLTMESKEEENDCLDYDEDATDPGKRNHSTTCAVCRARVRLDRYSKHLLSNHLDVAIRSMLSQKAFVDKHIQIGEQDTREVRISTTPFMWWVSASGTPYSYLTCCLRCDRIPFHTNNPSSTRDKWNYKLWTEKHRKKGCFDHLDEFREKTGTTLEGLATGKTIRNIVAAVRTTDDSLYEKSKKPAKPKPVVKPVLSAKPVIVNELAEETEDALREWEVSKYGYPEDGDTPNTISEVIDCLLADYNSLKRIKTDGSVLNDLRNARKEVAARDIKIQEMEYEIEELRMRVSRD
jgi:hypothetical protein